MSSFPISPTPNEEYTEGNVTYVYTGTKWKQVGIKSSQRGQTYVASNNQISLDLSQASLFDLDYSSNTVISFVNPPAAGYAQRFEVLLNSPAVATPSTVTWPSNIQWEKNSAPVLTPGKSSLIEFYTDITNSTYFASTPERDI